MSDLCTLPQATVAVLQGELKKLEARQKVLKEELVSVQLGIKIMNKALKGVLENDQ